MHTTTDKLAEFERLLDIMTELRSKCPWDKEQTFDSMRVQTIEETYELVDAIIQKDKIAIRKELGDLLLHVIFYAQMGSETNDFDIYDVCKSLNEKLIYRHPHVFGEVEANNAKEVVQNWEQLKLKEKGGNTSVLSGVPDALPALIKAHRIQDKARSVGFDWEEREQVWDKVQEEFDELKVEISDMDKDKMEGEFGDLLFSLINAARLYDINPENALERTNRKFISRFNYLESKTITIGKDLKAMSLDEMDVLWDEAKKIEKEKEPLASKGGF
jgi:MazG family protein